MAKNPTPSKGTPVADQQEDAKPDEATNASSGTTATAPAAGGQPSTGGEPGSSGDNAGNPLPTEQGPAVNTQVDAPVAVTALPATGATADNQSLLLEQPVKKAYAVTGRTDVLHDGKLYAEGDLVWLDQDSARPLLNNRCITATGDAQ